MFCVTEIMAVDVLREFVLVVIVRSFVRSFVRSRLRVSLSGPPETCGAPRADHQFGDPIFIEPFAAYVRAGQYFLWRVPGLPIIFG